jgi:hypothetical protein
MPVCHWAMLFTTDFSENQINNRKKNSMDYTVIQSKQVGIEAETPEEAVKKVLSNEGVVISCSFSANPRPPRPPTGTPVAHVAPGMPR